MYSGGSCIPNEATLRPTAAERTHAAKPGLLENDPPRLTQRKASRIEARHWRTTGTDGSSTGMKPITALFWAATALAAVSLVMILYTTLAPSQNPNVPSPAHIPVPAEMATPITPPEKTN